MTNAAFAIESYHFGYDMAFRPGIRGPDEQKFPFFPQNKTFFVLNKYMITISFVWFDYGCFCTIGGFAGKRSPPKAEEACLSPENKERKRRPGGGREAEDTKKHRNRAVSVFLNVFPEIRGDQRLLNWGARRAALRPYFLRSFMRGSRVR